MPDTELYDRIKARAYSLWEQEDRPEGRADEHWRRAEAEVTGASSGEDGCPGTPRAGVHVCPAREGTGRHGRSRCKERGGTGRIIDASQGVSALTTN